MIAHNLSTVQQADVIFVVDHGRVCERGTHASLLEAGGVYARLYGLQNARGEAAPNYPAPRRSVRVTPIDPTRAE
jgi:ABC-type transport system involved in cytochrome bd biosynthesis fused ATPase/permease subunit